MTDSRRDLLKLGLLLSAGAGLTACKPGMLSAMTDDTDRAQTKASPAEEDASEGITARTIAEAEKLAGVSFTDAERAQLLDTGFESVLETIARVRAFDKPNDLAPALVFSPKLPGRSFRVQENRFFPAEIEPAPLPDKDEDIAFASVSQLSAWLQTRALTSRRLTEIYLDRIARYADKLECFVTVTADLARAEADTADRELDAGRPRSLIHGIPYGLKDIIDTKAIKTTWGAAPYRTRVPDQDAAIVTRLRGAGAVLLGKTTVGALAYGDIWFGGKTRNPWNPEEGSSGSSAGSASATAAGLCAFGIGTETLGSIVSPSNRCGTTGLRPTFGRVSRTGAMALCWSLDKIGPICRSAEDTALVLQAINGYDPADPSSVETGFDYDARVDLKSLRVGIDPVWFEAGSDTDRAALEALKRLGVQIKEISLPRLPYSALPANLLIESAAAFEELTLSDRDDEMVWQDNNAWPNTWRQMRLFPAVDSLQIDRLRRRVMEVMDEQFSELDAMFGPNFAGNLLVITNFTGHPCITLRAGFQMQRTRGLSNEPENADGPEFRVPANVSIWGPLFEDGKIVALARALEGELGVASVRPSLGMA